MWIRVIDKIWKIDILFKKIKIINWRIDNKDGIENRKSWD